ncbi:MAG: protein-L-isoaspartate O-methyltransferase [Alphaproteobacteria bacterium]|nr:MAG: protein-L-isoaspartate O-methyltransferase [Alphaproteobacteria bacterium]
MTEPSPGEVAAQSRRSMISGQILPNRVHDPRVLDAMESVPREHFVPKCLRGVAYVDEDLAVAPRRYLLEPMILARLLSEAEITPGDTVLDIACATGYSTAVLARLAETVVAVEEESELAAQASEKLAALGVDNAVVLEAPLTAGAPKEAPFDVILINGAVEVIPEALTDQLGEGGRLVCVRREDGVSRGWLYTRSDGAVGGRPLFDAFSPLLPGFEAPRGFRF